MKRLVDLYDGDKPREKLLNKGAEALKSEELMAILLGSGVKGKDVRKLAREVVVLVEREFEGLSLEKLLGINGLGVAKASAILASIELSRRFLIKSNKKITEAKDVYEELREYANKTQEYFLLITLDGASHIIDKKVVFIGTINQSLVHPREVFAPAIEDRAAGVIVAHNHPSGSLSPSGADMVITDRLKEAGKLLGVELLDHVIISKEGYYSFSEENQL